jgi:hypothetical protein
MTTAGYSLPWERWIVTRADVRQLVQLIEPVARPDILPPAQASPGWSETIAYSSAWVVRDSVEVTGGTAGASEARIR